MIRGAIFDMDGVLVDSVDYHIRAWKQLGDELGWHFEEQEIRRIFGRRDREMLAELSRHPLPTRELHKRAARKEKIYRDLIAPELKPVAGLPEFLGDLKGRGIRTAVGTSGPQENVDLVLDGLDIRRYFDVIVFGLEVARSKPAPDIFLLAAERLHLDPGECVVFEDSPSGIEAAVKAGCTCIGVATTHTKEKLGETPAHRIIVDFTEIAADSLAEEDLRA